MKPLTFWWTCRGFPYHLMVRLIMALIHGLTNHVWQFLYAFSQMEQMDISQLLAQVRAILKDDQPRSMLITAAVEQHAIKKQTEKSRIMCYERNNSDCLIWCYRLKFKTLNFGSNTCCTSYVKTLPTFFQTVRGKESGYNSFVPASSQAKCELSFTNNENHCT